MTPLFSLLSTTEINAKGNSPHSTKAVVEVSYPISPRVPRTKNVFPSSPRVVKPSALGCGQQWFQTIENGEGGKQHFLLGRGDILPMRTIFEHAVTVLHDRKPPGKP